MSNLLEQSSILLSPTAYNNGSMLAVKPENGDGDFTFSRNSAATRVNAQGLVENVQILSSDLVSNGDFSNGSTDWNLGTNFSIADGKLKSINTANAAITNQSAFVFTIGKSYKLTFDISDYVEGNVRILFGGFNAGNFNSNGTFSVIGVANRVDEILIQSIGSNNTYSIDNISVKEITDNTNLPRINYEGFSYDTNGDIIPNSGCGSWLMEGQSTNLFTYSEDLSSSWTFINVNKTLKQVENPSGTLGAYEIAANSTVTSHYIELNPYSATSGVDYTFSFFAKINGSNFVQVASSTGFSPLYQNFNLLDGTLGNGNLTSGYSSSIEPFGNGWYRVSVKGTTISANARFLTVPILTDIASRNPSFNGDGTLGVYVWGFQKEQNSFPTSYIPTSGAASTRLQDIATNSGNASLINSEEGVLYFEGATTYDNSTSRRISLSDGSISNRVSLEFDESTENQIKVFITLNGASEVLVYDAPDLSIFNKIAIKWKANDFQIWLNGSAVVTYILESRVPIGMYKLAFDGGNGSNIFYGKTKALAVYKTALTDAQLTLLTKI